MKKSGFDFSTIDALENIGVLEAIICQAEARIATLRPLHLDVNISGFYIQKGAYCVGLTDFNIYPDKKTAMRISMMAYEMFRDERSINGLVLVECERGERVYITRNEAKSLAVGESEIVTE